MTEVTGNRKYKDRLFRTIFREKEDLLSLYNAMNDSDYEDPDLLEITTIDDVLYMGMKNDVSFLVEDYLNLYEAQATWCPNMPLRGLFYFARLYAGFVESRSLDIYSRTKLKLPTPRYVVFYNGTEREEEKSELRLSDSYEKKGDLECTATVLNINQGHNKALMEKCRKLYEYAYLVGKIRDFLELGKPLESAIDWAIADCLDRGILVEYLTKHQAEVKFMILSEYNEELHLKDTYEVGRADGWEEGQADGEKRVSKLMQILIDRGRMEDLKKAAVDQEFRKVLFEEFRL